MADRVSAYDSETGIFRDPVVEDRFDSAGADGKSAYQLATENGFVGTLAEWLASLKGDPGVGAAGGLAAVVVSTGGEARPAGPIVLWVGGTAQPANMTVGDIWLAEGDPEPPPPPGTPPTVTTTTLGPVTVGVALSRTLTASGTAPVAWAVTAGALPAGLALSAGGVLSGTPTTAGAYSFTVTATNTAGSDTQQYTGTVAAPAEPSAAESVFGTSPHTPAVTVHNDGEGALKMATAFYGTKQFRVVGARVFLPDEHRTDGDLSLWVAGGGHAGASPVEPSWGEVPLLAEIGRLVTIPAASIQAGWNEVTFPSPLTVAPVAVPLTAADQYCWVGYHFAGGNDYFHASGDGYATAIPTQPTAVAYLAEAGFAGAGRSANSASGGGIRDAFHGLDILAEAV